MRKFLFSVVLLLLTTGALFAQRTIKGKVTDDSGDPIPGATVQVKGTTTGTVAGADGTYSLGVPASAKSLVFSSVGMETIEIAIGSQSSINAVLKLSDKSLTEVIITGYSRIKKSQYAGGVTRLDSRVVETVPVGAFDQSLQGRAPGLQVSSGSGQPGASANLTIRGVQSIAGAFVQPLFIVDGVPLAASDMQTINPNDFESLTVLKDAAAAALYGARGGLGVIVITTKRGKSGVGSLTYRTQLGITEKLGATNFDLMNTAEALEYEERLGLAGLSMSTTPGWAYSKKNPSYAAATAEERARRDRLLDSVSRINTDFRDILFRTGISQTHELNFSGGTDKTKFYLSAGYFDQEGTDLTSSLKRYTARFNLDHVYNKLTVQFNMAAGYSITNLSEGVFLGNSARNSFQMSWRAKPYENPYKADGSLNFGASTGLGLRAIANVIEGMENTIMRQNQIKINSGFSLAYQLHPNFVLANRFGIDMADDRYIRNIKADSYVGTVQTAGSGYNAEATKIRAQLINTTSLTYSKVFNRIHDVEAALYYEAVREHQKGLGFQQWNLDPRLTETGQGVGTLPVGTGQTTYPQNSSSAKGGYGIQSYFGTARYTLDDKYTINGTLRRDATSRIINKNNRSITTWSAGVTWNAIKENFMNSQKVLTNLNVRGSYGIIPNIGSIATKTYAINGSLISVTNYLGNQLVGWTTSNAYYGSPITGIVPETPGYQDLKLERIKKLNFGVDLGAWNNRARLSVDYYRNKTVDLFVRNPLTFLSGFDNLDINAGIMTNKGFEFDLAVDVVKTSDLTATIGINHAINKNMIEDLGLVDEYVSGTYLIKKGLPYGSHYTPHYLGADPQTGRPMFEGADGKVVYEAGAAPQFANFGTFLPKHVGGFNLDVRYKRFALSALFSYQFDVVRSNNIENWLVRGTAGYQATVNGSKRLLTDQWQKPGDNKLYQSPQYDRGFTSTDLQDAKFLRFRNLNLSYQIPELNVGGTRLIRGAKFYVQAQNIAIWSPWRGPDPEDDNNISLNEFPNPRMMVAGLDINF
ncbi:SusC/RagA family TonB-linked outer membrane protein [Chitinophaga lutea]|uniref:SusC/RagA family TonB-linked outer membrane protein n=1 Tax=Chitinophaga lutea TaxID=2488634 RepID=A0A3N4PZ95_9BACT|nr:SusC/RagA family TonB-linked outer membrane protein [Chitinophaga lutea]RPE14123.1 SusC/RagA family TonB-linked outer membrane protein [Chitinophaga lutea]